MTCHGYSWVSANLTKAPWETTLLLGALAKTRHCSLILKLRWCKCGAGSQSRGLRLRLSLHALRNRTRRTSSCQRNSKMSCSLSKLERTLRDVIHTPIINDNYISTTYTSEIKFELGPVFWQYDGPTTAELSILSALSSLYPEATHDNPEGCFSVAEDMLNLYVTCMSV